MKELATWCVLHPGIKAFRDALGGALEGEPKPNLVRENRDRLWQVLSVIELCSTAEGRKNLGLKEEDLPTGPNIFSVLLSQPKSKIEIVRAERQFRAALDLSQEEMRDAIQAAVLKENMALLAFPIAAKIHAQLTSSEDPVTRRIEYWQNRHLAFQAVVRALASGAVAKTIRTDDLKSAGEGRPVDYSFDGTQMVVSVGRTDEAMPFKLKLPPDKPKK